MHLVRDAKLNPLFNFIFVSLQGLQKILPGITKIIDPFFKSHLTKLSTLTVF